MAVGLLTVAMIQAAGLAALIAGVGDPVLERVGADATRKAAVALAAKAMSAEKEPGLAMGVMALQFAQDNAV